MIVITLTNCPPALRGDLTKWLQEINTGVYVGQVSARVRDILWKRVQDNTKHGSATMVFSKNNEQRMDFRVHNTIWEPIDFDGLKLMLRPSPARVKKLSEVRMGFSNAARFRKVKQMSGRKRRKPLPETYAVINIETTGPSTREDELRKINALMVTKGEIHNRFSSLIDPKTTFDLSTNAPASANQNNGRKIAQVLPEFLSFIGDVPVIAHNEDLIYGFLRTACERCGLPLFSNQCVDIIGLARRLVDDVKNYRLETLLTFFNIETSDPNNCETTKLLYDKLIEIQDSSV
jgi:CRISPR-associated protein Cas2